MRWILFIASRFLRTTRMSRRSVPSVLSISGIATGVVALIVVLAVMNGFQMGFIEDILEITSFHIRISASSELPESVLQQLRATQGIRSVLPFDDVQTLAKGMFTQFEPCKIRGLPDNAGEIDRQFIDQINIVNGHFDLESGNNIVLGIELASNLSASIGSVVSIMSLAGDSFDFLEPESTEFIVSGIFESGYYDFDRTLAFVLLTDSEKLRTGNEIYRYGIKLKDRYSDGNMIAVLSSQLEFYGAEIISWREYNRSFFSALRIEKLAMTILLGLIFIVVGFNIFHSLRRTVYERREDIAVLKSIGASPAAVRMIFVLDGFLIGAVGAVIGTVTGLLIAENVNYVFYLFETIINGFLNTLSSLNSGIGEHAGSVRIFSPSFFYLSEVPTRTIFSEVLLIFLFSVICSIGAAYFASKRISDFQPARILRYE